MEHKKERSIGQNYSMKKPLKQRPEQAISALMAQKNML